MSERARGAWIIARENIRLGNQAYMLAVMVLLLWAGASLRDAYLTVRVWWSEPRD